MAKINHIIVDDETHRAIKIMAVKRGLTMGQMVKELLRLAEKDKDDDAKKLRSPPCPAHYATGGVGDYPESMAKERTIKSCLVVNNLTSS